LCLAQLLDAEQQRLEQLTAENARMEREYQRFKKKKMITDKIAVSVMQSCDAHGSGAALLCALEVVRSSWTEELLGEVHASTGGTIILLHTSFEMPASHV